MCGRFTLRASPAQVQEMFDLLRAPELEPRYNIAPSQPVVVVRLDARQSRVADHLVWGLVPSWAKDVKIGSRMINARSESAAEKPAFRAAFRRRRCLIPADGFYEWQGTAGRKQPYFISLKSGDPFAFAGLWEIWEGDDGSTLESCTILTTEANNVLSELHDRMPVILPRTDYEEWLTTDEESAPALQRLLAPYPSEAMQFVPVSRAVNSPKNEGPACLEPAADQQSLF